MITGEVFLKELQKQGIEFFSGVPDSLMKGFLSCLHSYPNHYITSNEGGALAMAAGYHLATGLVPLVYLQNSGLGNLINPLTSLADKEVYSIPLILLIGWRGEPGKKDEAQHKKMGAVTIPLLKALEVPFYIFSNDIGQQWVDDLTKAVHSAKELNQPVALVIQNDFFSDNETELDVSYELSAKNVIEGILPLVDAQDIVVCTTGKIGRLFYDLNQQNDKKIEKYFLNTGAMGHAGLIATALATYSNKHVILLDGDGSLLMHLGNLATHVSLQANICYIVLNNGAHQSVGGQPTAGFSVDFCSIAKACGFEKTFIIENEISFKKWQTEYRKEKQFVEIRINTLMPAKLPRPDENFREAKNLFMTAIKRK